MTPSTQRTLRIVSLLSVVALALPPVHAAREPLHFGDIGIYGTLYDFCTFSVYKLFPTEDAERLAHYRDMIHRSHAAGKFNLVGLYSFDRVKHSQPIETYIRQTDQLLDAIDHAEVDAVFLSEENVTWNNGLEILNQLYGHVKSRYDGPVYQWYTMPDVPHPKQRADGWIIDPYGFRHTEFRRYLMKYLVQGKPVIACINASEDVAEWESSHEQVLVCREFSVPTFFYAVDREFGAPNIWLRSDEPGLAQWRGWVFRVMEMAQATPTALPEPGAQFSPGRPVEVAADEGGIVQFEEDFAEVSFLDDATVTGFLRLRWSGEEETLTLVPDGTPPGAATLSYHFFSVLPMHNGRVSVATTGAGVGVEVSTDGQTWQASETTTEGWEGQNLWVRLTLSSPPGGRAGPVLDSWLAAARAAPPAERAIELKAVRGRVHYEDPFEAPRYLQLAEVDRPEELIWRRGSLSIRGTEGRVNRVEVRQRFTCEQPLRNLRVELDSRAWERDLNAHNELGLSLDGREVLVSETTRGKAAESGRYDGTLTLEATDDDGFGSVREFWVHLVMVNASGVHTNPSNVLRNLDVRADVALEGDG
jgi:hypothetical protein